LMSMVATCNLSRTVDRAIWTACSSATSIFSVSSRGDCSRPVGPHEKKHRGRTRFLRPHGASSG
jgi:hypothetical protein